MPGTSWLDALSSAGALAGLVAVALGQPWGDPVAGLAVTAFICHVGYQVTTDVVHRLADGVDPSAITAAEAAAGSGARGDPRSRPGPMDRTNPAGRDRGLGRSRPFRPGRRYARPCGRRCAVAAPPGGGQLHLDNTGRPGPTSAPPRRRPTSRPLAPVTRGLTRSLTDSTPCSSGRTEAWAQIPELTAGHRRSRLPVNRGHRLRSASDTAALSRKRSFPLHRDDWRPDQDHRWRQRLYRPGSR